MRGRGGPLVAERTGAAAPARRTRRPPAGRACPRGRSGPPRRGRPAPRRPGRPRPGGRRPHLQHGRLVARPRAGRRPTGRGRWRPRRPQPGRRVEAAVDDRVVPLPEHRRVEVRVGDLPHRDGVLVLGPGPRGPHGDPLQGEHGGDVGEQADAGRGRSTVTRDAVARSASTETAAAPLAGGLGDRRRRRRGPATRRRPGPGPRGPAGPGRATSPARQLDHALGEVARASASVSAVEQRRGSRRQPTRAATTLDGRRVVEVAGGGRLGEQQVPAHQRRDQVDRVRRRSPSGWRPARAIGSPATLWSVRLALADVVQQGGDHQHVGTRRPDGSAADASMQVSTTCRSTVKRWIGEACGSSRIALPLGQDPVERAGLVEGLPHRQQPRSGGEQPHEQAAGPRRATARAAAAHSRTSRAAVAGASTSVVLGGGRGGTEQQQRVLRGPGPAVQHDLARGQRHAGRERGRAPGAAAPADVRAA